MTCFMHVCVGRGVPENYWDPVQTGEKKNIKGKLWEFEVDPKHINYHYVRCGDEFWESKLPPTTKVSGIQTIESFGEDAYSV